MVLIQIYVQIYAHVWLSSTIFQVHLNVLWGKDLNCLLAFLLPQVKLDGLSFCTTVIYLLHKMTGVHLANVYTLISSNSSKWLI